MTGFLLCSDGTSAPFTEIFLRYTMTFANILNLLLIIKFDSLTVYNKYCSTDSTWKSKNWGISGSQDLHKHHE